ncbi:MAG: nucleotidyltransferase domain-containing protein [Treponema sp.]|jgi:predicted nucleotidyltransferase|nr:nucleotidyltransferase domain-containing protein [Treponema sp.]
MDVNFEAIESAVKDYVVEVKRAMPIDKVYLFGSYAKGNPREDSDVDICFFSSNFGRPPSEDVFLTLLSLTRGYARNNVYIEPHAFPVSELSNDNPFVKEILRTGREI